MSVQPPTPRGPLVKSRTVTSDWTPDHDLLLIELHGRNKSVKQISMLMPDVSRQMITDRANMLDLDWEMSSVKNQKARTRAARLMLDRVELWERVQSGMHDQLDVLKGMKAGEPYRATRRGERGTEVEHTVFDGATIQDVREVTATLRDMSMTEKNLVTAVQQEPLSADMLAGLLYRAMTAADLSVDQRQAASDALLEQMRTLTSDAPHEAIVGKILP